LDNDSRLSDNQGKDSPQPAPRTALRLPLVLLLVAAAYGYSLAGTFLVDDFFNLQNAVEAGWSWNRLERGFVVDVSRFHDGWMTPDLAKIVVKYYRPLFLASLVADHALWGLRPFGYHLTNVLLHLLVVAFLYGVLCEVLNGRRGPAAFGAFLYGLSHFNFGAVGWVSGRTEELPALAMLAALWGFVRFSKTRQWPHYALSVGATVAGLMAKENAIVLPLVLLAAWWWVVPRPRPAVWLLVPHAALAALYLPWRYHVLGGFPLPPLSFYYHPPTEPGFVWWALAKAALVFYALLFQLPLGFPADLALSRAPAITLAMLAVAVLIALWLARVVGGERDDEWRRGGCFAVTWIVLGLLPTAPIFMVGFYFYFPLGGACLLYLVIWHRLIERGHPRWLSRPRLQRAIPVATACLFALVPPTLSWFLVLAGREVGRTIDQVAAQIGEPRDGLRIYGLDVPITGGWAKSALELRWPGRRFEFHILTGSPYFLPAAKPNTRIEQLDARTLRLTATGWPYFSGIFGLLITGEQARDAIRAGNVWPVRGYRIEITQDELFGRRPQRCVRQLVLHFDQPLASPDNVFLQFYARRVEKIEIR
jgi:hypothetical protein